MIGDSSYRHLRLVVRWLVVALMSFGVSAVVYLSLVFFIPHSAGVAVGLTGVLIFAVLAGIAIWHSAQAQIQAGKLYGLSWRQSRRLEVRNPADFQRSLADIRSRLI